MDPIPEGQRPRGVTPRLRSGAAAGRSYPTPPCPRPGAAAERSHPSHKVGAAAERSHPMPEVRGYSSEGQPHVQGAAAARAQEGQEELLHHQGQEGQL